MFFHGKETVISPKPPFLDEVPDRFDPDINKLPSLRNSQGDPLEGFSKRLSSLFPYAD
jgi:hypothetical protein